MRGKYNLPNRYYNELCDINLAIPIVGSSGFFASFFLHAVNPAAKHIISVINNIFFIMTPYFFTSLPFSKNIVFSEISSCGIVTPSALTTSLSIIV